ncbi:MAG: hypothetical protein JWO93_1023, partial [Micrococcaceae bacterium]|nr:hypothetical protein [Micrococcaceae bacterium]
FVIGIGSLLLGVVLMGWWYRTAARRREAEDALAALPPSYRP